MDKEEIMEMSQGMTCRVLHYPLETSGAFNEEILIPENDWNRPEWRNGLLKSHPEIDATQIEKEFARA